MTFRHISELAGDVMRRIEMQGCGCSDERAPAPAYPLAAGKSKSTATGMRVATDAQREEETPVAFAQAGKNAAQTELGKWADAETPARVGQEVSQTEDKSRGGSAMSNRKHTLTVLPVSKRMKVARPTGVAPRQAAFIHLVTVDGHRVAHPH